jgi:transposase
VKAMRGSDGMQEALFTVAKLEDFVPADHPLRPIRALVNEALGRLNGLFNLVYADTGRASIAPEKLLRAMLIQVFFSVRSERQLMEQVRYNLLYRWFIGLAIDDEVWDHSTFSKNRDRLLEHDPDTRLFRKSHNTAAIMAYQGHVLMENRSGLVVGAVVTHADGIGRACRGTGDARYLAWHSPQDDRRGQGLRHA